MIKIKSLIIIFLVTLSFVLVGCESNDKNISSNELNTLQENYAKCDKFGAGFLECKTNFLKCYKDCVPKNETLPQTKCELYETFYKQFSNAAICVEHCVNIRNSCEYGVMIGTYGTELK